MFHLYLLLFQFTFASQLFPEPGLFDNIPTLYFPSTILGNVSEISLIIFHTINIIHLQGFQTCIIGTLHRKKNRIWCYLLGHLLNIHSEFHHFRLLDFAVHLSALSSVFHTISAIFMPPLQYQSWILPLLPFPPFVYLLDFAVHLSTLSPAAHFSNQVISVLLFQIYSRKLVSCSYFLSSYLDSSPSSLCSTGNLSCDDWFSCRIINYFELVARWHHPTSLFFHL